MGSLGRTPATSSPGPATRGRLTYRSFRGRRDGEPLWTPERIFPPLLGQLLDNLLENACKYSEPGTPITVRAWCEPEAVALEVEDCGCGIPAEELSRVFEPFYRAESARRLGCTGVGLGLAVAQRIAVTHGGTITAESEPGRGSRFVVRMPRGSDVAPAAVDHPASGRPGLGLRSYFACREDRMAVILILIRT